MEDFNINVLHKHFNVILDAYKYGFTDKQLPYDYNKLDLETDLYRLLTTKDKIYLYQLEGYQKAFFNIVKASEKHLRGVQYSETFNIDNQRMRVRYQNKTFAVLILRALSEKIDTIKKNKAEENDKINKTIVKGEVAAAFCYFLAETKYIYGNNRKKLAEAALERLNEMNIVNTKNEHHKVTSIESQLNRIYASGGLDKNLTPKIISNTMDLLKNFPKALTFAKELYND